MDSNKSYKISECKTSYDFLKVFPLLHELSDEENIDGISSDVCVREFEKAQKYGYRQFYVEYDYAIVGTIGIRPFYDPLCPTHGYAINNFIVAKQFRGKKVAELLLKKAQNIVQQGGGNWAMGWSVRGHPQLQKWYKKLGCSITHDLIQIKFDA